MQFFLVSQAVKPLNEFNFTIKRSNLSIILIYEGCYQVC